MIILPMLVAAAAVPAGKAARFEVCTALAARNPVRALSEAGTWRLGGGGILALQCEGLAYASQKRWVPAATAFEAAARLAERDADGRAATLWVQAGNAALAGGDAARGRAAFDAALARGTLAAEALGEAHLDRARARAALGDLPGARSDLDAAIQRVPADPLGWLLSATLARRMNDLPRAQADIAEAARRSPDDASVAYEAGTIAMRSGNETAARTAWQAAIKLQPGGPAAQAATEALKQAAASR